MAKCQYADLLAVGGTTIDPCVNEADFDLDVKAGTYVRSYEICEEHAAYMMDVTMPAASEIELNADGETKLYIPLDAPSEG